MKNFFLSIVILGIVFISIAVYLNTLHNDFVNFDDLDLIVRNKYIKTLSLRNIQAIFTPGVVGSYQPLRTFSYAIDYHFWKLNPTGYHLTNIFWNALNTLFVYILAYTLTRTYSLACFAALLFAVHPIHVEAVTWMSGRRDVLSLAWILFAFSCFLRSLPPTWRSKPSRTNRDNNSEGSSIVLWYGLSVGFFILGLLTKPSVVIFPLLLVLYDVCFIAPISRLWKRAYYYIPFFLVSAGFTFMFTSLARTSGVAKPLYHGGSPYMTLLTMLKVFGEYIEMLIFPKYLSATYGIDIIVSVWVPSFLLAVSMLGITLILTVIAWKKARIVFFGICWFFIGLIPMSNIIPISTVKADRYLYLPSVGFFLAIAWCLVRCWDALKQIDTTGMIKKCLFAAYWLMIVTIMGSYAFLTIQRNRDWKDSHTLWTATLETNPDSAIALNNLGVIYSNQGMYEKAVALFELVVEKHPFQEKMERVYRNIAKAYADQQLFDQAIDYYQQALELNPEYGEAYIGLGEISTQLGDYQKAAEIYHAALELNPEDESLYNHLGNLSFIQKNYDEAIAYFRQALQLDPFSVDAYNGLGLSYTRKGEIDQALSIYRQALEQNADSMVLRNSLAALYMEIGEPEKAIDEFSASLAQDPGNVEIRNNLGTLYLHMARYKDAAQEFITSLKVQPNNPNILNNLGIAYTYLGLYDEAILIYQQALEVDPSSVRTYVLLGDVCLGTDRPACALEAYQYALELQPGNKEILEKLESAKRKSAEHKN